MEKTQNEKNVVSDMKTRMTDILIAISWGFIAKNYFSKSVSWFYNKMNGIDGNGGIGGFTPEEAQQLKGALCDLADRIRKAADSI